MEQIIAMGGSGFSMESTHTLDQYILETSAKKPRICFLGTASGDSESYIVRFYKRFSQTDCYPTHLELFRREVKDLNKFLESQDIIYVGGGNTANMLTIWKLHGVDIALKNALHKGTILAGLSAGSICWFDEGITDSFGKSLEPYKGLGFISGSHSPHYDSEVNRRPIYHELIRNHSITAGIAADDGVALHYINGDFHKAVSSRPEAFAYRVELINEEIIETKIVPVYL